MTIDTVEPVTITRKRHGTLYAPPKQAGRLSENDVIREFPINPEYLTGYDAAEKEKLLTPLGRAILVRLRECLKGKTLSIHLGPLSLWIHLLPGGRDYTIAGTRDRIQEVVDLFMEKKTTADNEPVKESRSI